MGAGRRRGTVSTPGCGTTGPPALGVAVGMRIGPRWSLTMAPAVPAGREINAVVPSGITWETL